MKYRYKSAENNAHLIAGAQVGSKLLLGSAEMNKCLFLVLLPLSREGEEESHPRVRFANML